MPPRAHPGLSPSSSAGTKAAVDPSSWTKHLLPTMVAPKNLCPVKVVSFEAVLAAGFGFALAVALARALKASLSLVEE